MSAEDAGDMKDLFFREVEMRDGLPLLSLPPTDQR